MHDIADGHHVSLLDLVVVGVVSQGDLEHAGDELDVRVAICDAEEKHNKPPLAPEIGTRTSQPKGRAYQALSGLICTDASLKWSWTGMLIR